MLYEVITEVEVSAGVTREAQVEVDGGAIGAIAIGAVICHRRDVLHAGDVRGLRAAGSPPGRAGQAGDVGRPVSYNFV